MEKMGKMLLEKYGEKIMDAVKNKNISFTTTSSQYPIDSLKNHRSLGPFPLVSRKKIKPGQAAEEMELINKKMKEYSELEIKQNEKNEAIKTRKMEENQQEADARTKSMEASAKIGKEVIDISGNVASNVLEAGLSLIDTAGKGVVSPGISALSSTTGALFSTGTGFIKEFFRGITRGKPITLILWFIVTILLIIFIILLLIGGIGTLSSGGDSNNKSTCSDLTLVEVNDISQYTRYGITTNNYSTPLNFRPSFISQPNFDLFNMDYYSNYFATTEPFSSIYSYANMMAYIASGGSKSLIDREPLKTSRCNNVVSAKTNENKIVNVLKPQDIKWTLRESEHPELQKLPPTYRDALLKNKYTVYIPWKKEGNVYTIDCKGIYYIDNDKKNISLDILNEHCQIYTINKT